MTNKMDMGFSPIAPAGILEAVPGTAQTGNTCRQRTSIHFRTELTKQKCFELMQRQ
jgi:hypothetical protein